MKYSSNNRGSLTASRFANMNGYAFLKSLRHEKIKYNLSQAIFSLFTQPPSIWGFIVTAKMIILSVVLNAFFALHMHVCYFLSEFLPE